MEFCFFHPSNPHTVQKNVGALQQKTFRLHPIRISGLKYTDHRCIVPCSEINHVFNITNKFTLYGSHGQKADVFAGFASPKFPLVKLASVWHEHLYYRRLAHRPILERLFCFAISKLESKNWFSERLNILISCSL